MTDEERWLLVWSALVAAVVAAEVIAIRSGEPHRPLSHHLRRRMPLGNHIGRVGLLYAAWRLHRHLYPGEKP